MKIFKDGNKWCVLHGANQQSGISAFGDSELEALESFSLKISVLVGALKDVHSWCVGNIESKGCDEITPYCILVRDRIEKTGVIK